MADLGMLHEVQRHLSNNASIGTSRGLSAEKMPRDAKESCCAFCSVLSQVGGHVLQSFDQRQLLRAGATVDGMRRTDKRTAQEAWCIY